MFSDKLPSGTMRLYREASWLEHSARLVWRRQRVDRSAEYPVRETLSAKL